MSPTKTRKPGSARWLVVVAVLIVGLLTACQDTCVFCDTETRPATAADALAEANQTLDSIGETTLKSASFTIDEWLPDNGCATHPDEAEQGEVDRILYRTYAELPSGTTAESLVADLSERWEKDGLIVGSLAPGDSEEAVITRTKGIGYYLVSTPPGVQLRASIPCY